MNKKSIKLLLFFVVIMMVISLSYTVEAFQGQPHDIQLYGDVKGSYIQCDGTRTVYAYSDLIDFTGIQKIDIACYGWDWYNGNGKNDFVQITMGVSTTQTTANFVSEAPSARWENGSKTGNKWEEKYLTINTNNITGKYYLTAKIEFLNVENDGNGWDIYYARATYAEPTITKQPVDTTVNLGDTATFTCAASPATSYQWYKNGIAVAGATNPNYSFATSMSDVNASVYCVAYNGTSYANSSSAILTVNVPPTITKQPVDTTVNLGDTATFSCTGSPATSYQWYKNGVAVAGATGSSFTLVTTESDKNALIYCRVYNHGAYTNSRTVTLGVNLLPKITLQPVDTVTIEDKPAVFTCTAISQLGVSYQWQQYDGSNWNNISTGTSLIISNPTIEEDGNKYRCICSNSAGSVISNEVKLTVANSSILDLTVQYPLPEIDFAATLSTSDLFAVIKYNNGNALVSQNLEGLLFDSVEIKKPDNSVIAFNDLASDTYLFTVLGDYTFTVKYTADVKDPYTGVVSAKTFKPTFTIKCVDKSAPEILSHQIMWQNGDIVNNLTNTDDSIIIEVLAEDNVTDMIEFEWYKNETNGLELIKEFDKKNSIFTVSSSMGNGIYIVKAKDEAGNISEEYKINVTIWDMDAPVFYYEVTKGSEWTKMKELNIYAFDNIELAETSYFILEQTDEEKDYSQTDWIKEKDWTSLNSFVIEKNGTYSIYVRDRVGNIAHNSVTINKIDNLPPVTEITAIRAKDLKSVEITIKAFDDGGSGLYQEDGEYKCFYIENDYDITLTDSGGYVTGKLYTKENGVYTIYTKDNAGNIDTTSIVIDVDQILYGGDGNNGDELTYISNIRAENTDGSIFPAYTNKSIRLFAEVADDTFEMSTKAYSWDYSGSLEEWDGSGAWSNDNSLLVTENGIYTAFVKDVNDNIYRRKIEITTIDKVVPELMVSTADNILTIQATDSESGIQRIMVDGGSLDTLQEKKYIAGLKNIQEDVFISENGEYKIYVFDAAGNVSNTITKEISNLPEKGIYTVTFRTYDDSIIKSERIQEGEDATPPSDPKREGHVFTGWDKPYTGIMQNTDIKALFVKKDSDTASDNMVEEGDSEKIYYTVSFKTYNGSIIKSQKVEAGEDATPPSNPKRDGYMFVGWDGSYANVQGDIEVTAIFELDNTVSENKANKSSNTGGGGTTKKGGTVSHNSISENTVSENSISENEIEKFIYLTDYSSEARPLSISQEDMLLQQETQQEKKSIFPEEVVEVEQPNDRIEESSEGISPAVAIIGALGLLVSGAIVFYFLNKKYYWVSLPF